MYCVFLAEPNRLETFFSDSYLSQQATEKIVYPDAPPE